MTVWPWKKLPDQSHLGEDQVFCELQRDRLFLLAISKNVDLRFARHNEISLDPPEQRILDLLLGQRVDQFQVRPAMGGQGMTSALKSANHL